MKHADFPGRMGYTCNYVIYSSSLFFINLFKVCAGVWDTEVTLFNVLEREKIQKYVKDYPIIREVTQEVAGRVQ